MAQTRVRLSEGVISDQLYDVPEGSHKLLDSPLTLQVLSIKQILRPLEPVKYRYRFILSDGQYYAQAMLDVELNAIMGDGGIVKNSVIVVEQMLAHTVESKHLLIIKVLHVLCKEHEKIGSPQPLHPHVSLQDASRSFAESEAIAAPTSGADESSPLQPVSEPERDIFPIEHLSNFRSTFTIKARVAQKSEIKTFGSPPRQGRYFNTRLQDDTGEIQATAWDRDADNFFDKLQRGGMYYISNGKVQKAKKQYNFTKHDYELTFQSNTVIEECQDTLPARPRFTPLADLRNAAKDSVCDVVGIMTDTGAVSETTMFDNKTVLKREITIIDQAVVPIRVTLWSRRAQEFHADLGSVLTFAGIKVKEFRGSRSLSCGTMAVIEVNPDIPEAHVLREWYEAGGRLIQARFGPRDDSFDYSSIWHLYDAQQAELGIRDEKEVAFSVQATIVDLKRVQSGSFAYPSCQECDSLKKVEQRQDGWWCGACKRSWDEPSYLYNFLMTVADYSGRSSLTVFDEVGQKILGVTASELTHIRENNPNEFAQFVESAIGKSYNFMCTARKDTYNDRVRAHYNVEQIFPRDYIQDGYYLKALLTSSWAQS